MLQITTQRAKEFNIEPQDKNESDDAFRHRVFGKLREMGHIIEAHEAQGNCLYDDPSGNAMTGIVGAMALAMQGKQYSQDGISQVGDDIAAGAIAQSPQRSKEEDFLLLTMAMLGGQ